MSAVAAGETAGAPALGPASDPTPTPAGSRRGATRGGAGWAWLRERGMGATILVAAISTAFGVLLLSATGYIGAATATPRRSSSGC